jgi:ubiquinone biosynthesis protein
MLATVRGVSRLYVIARTLARHDALFPFQPFPWGPALTTAARLFGGKANKKATGRDGERLAAALEALGPSFIKLGQSLSTRSDLLGEEVADDLSKLQDHLPAFDAATARASLEAELGEPVEALFSEFDDEPQAAASIAQVHFAVTTEGLPVAVKILRPEIESAFARDIRFFYWCADLAERTRPELRRLKPLQVIDTFKDSVRMEMDLRLEAAAAQEMAENFADDDSFRVPGVDWRRTARRVLTTERIEGLPIDERDAIIAAGHAPEMVLEKAASAFFNQVFRDGFFHADQHPGNIFVEAGGAIAAVDFGIMGRLDPPTRRYLGEMLLGFLQRDYRRVAEIHFEAGYVPADKSVDAFTQACRAIAEPILDKPQNEISMARLLAHLFQVTETFEMETQPQLLLLQKTMLVVEGVGRKLCPEANMWVLAQPLIENWMRDNLGPEARISEAAEDVAKSLRRLPKMVAEVERSATSLTDGGLRLHPDTVRQMRAPDGRRHVISPKAYMLVIVILVGLLLFL